MKMRGLMVGIIAAGLAGMVGSAQAAERIEIASNFMPEIKVDGPSSKGPYASVETKTLELVVSARSDKERQARMWIFKEHDQHYSSYGIQADLEKHWKKFKLTAPYYDLDPIEIANERISPVELCNERLNAASGAAREKFLKSGVSFVHHKAYSIQAYDIYTADTGFTTMPAKITCVALDRPRPREKSETKGPPPREGREMAPTIKKMTLRIEPAQVVQDGKFLCPSQLKLHGFVETRRAFYGKALFVGPHYLSSITTLNLQSKGTRNVSATYAMDWHKMGGLAIAPNAEPKKQKLTFRFNIADEDGKLLESVAETVEVSCKKIKVNAPTAGDGMTVNPAN